MKKFYFYLMCIIVLFIGGMNAPLIGQDLPTISLQFASEQVCGPGEYCATVQLKLVEPNDSVQIGTSSIFIEYDSSALNYSSYTPLNFNGDANCALGLFSVWDPIVVNGTQAGKINLVMTLTNSTDLEGFSCPKVYSDSWTDVAEVCFTVLNPNESVDLEFSDNPSFTNFNYYEQSNGIESIPVDYDNLGNVYENPQSSGCELESCGPCLGVQLLIDN